MVKGFDHQNILKYISLQRESRADNRSSNDVAILFMELATDTLWKFVQGKPIDDSIAADCEYRCAFHLPLRGLLISPTNERLEQDTFQILSGLDYLHRCAVVHRDASIICACCATMYPASLTSPLVTI